MKQLEALGLSTKQFIKALGGSVWVANYCGIKSPSVSLWIRSNHIPDGPLYLLAPLAEVKKIATRQQLCPEAWPKLWPELGPVDAPKWRLD